MQGTIVEKIKRFLKDPTPVVYTFFHVIFKVITIVGPKGYFM